ncbi:hypothetical protein BH10BAC2_BH10BAC2_28270 [soil metagenome]
MNHCIYINIFRKQIGVFLFITFLILSSSCNNNQQEEQKVEEDSVVMADDIAQEDSILFFENKTDEWLDLSLNNNNTAAWKKFKLKEFWYEDSIQKQPFKPESGFYKDFAPLLKWSPDSSYILDIGTYGKVLVKDKNGKTSIQDGEVDTKASLIFTKKDIVAELIFLGAGGSIIDGHWIDSTQFSMLIVSDAENVHRPDTLLWLIDAKENFFRKYKWE